MTTPSIRLSSEASCSRRAVQSYCISVSYCFRWTAGGLSRHSSEFIRIWAVCHTAKELAEYAIITSAIQK